MDVSGYAAMDLKGLNFKDCAEYSVSNQKRIYSNELCFGQIFGIFARPLLEPAIDAWMLGGWVPGARSCIYIGV
jgi:hypothetical protein